jgi:hypothetical protein
LHAVADVHYQNNIQENNRSELQRLDRERKEDFLAMLKGFVASQVQLQAFNIVLFHRFP